MVVSLAAGFVLAAGLGFWLASWEIGTSSDEDSNFFSSSSSSSSSESEDEDDDDDDEEDEAFSLSSESESESSSSEPPVFFVSVFVSSTTGAAESVSESEPEPSESESESEESSTSFFSDAGFRSSRVILDRMLTARGSGWILFAGLGLALGFSGSGWVGATSSESESSSSSSSSEEESEDDDTGVGVGGGRLASFRSRSADLLAAGDGGTPTGGTDAGAGAAPPSYPSSRRLARTTPRPTAPNRVGDMSSAALSACVTRVGSVLNVLYPFFWTRAHSTPTARRLTTSAGAATPGASSAASNAPAFNAFNRLNKSSNMSNVESFCVCTMACTAGSTVRSSASSEDVSNFSTAVTNFALASKDLAKTTLRSGTEPVSSPPCLKSSFTPPLRCASAAASARSCLAFLSAASFTLARDGGGGMAPASVAPFASAGLLPRTLRELASAKGLSPAPGPVIGVPPPGAPNATGVGIMLPP